MPWAPELFSAPALQRILDKYRRERLRSVPFFDGVMTGEIDALIESFEPDGYMREPAGDGYVDRGTDELRALYELFLANGGGISLEHCAVTDDGRACALEYNVVAWGRTELAPEPGPRRLRPWGQRQARRRARLRRLRPAAERARLADGATRRRPFTLPRTSGIRF